MKHTIATCLSAALLLALCGCGESETAKTNNAGSGDSPEIASTATIEAVLTSAQTLIRDGSFAKATVVLEEAVGDYPEDQDLRISLGDALMAQQRLDGAYQAFVAALAIGPREPVLEFKAGTLASVLGETERAVEHFSAAQSADPTNPDYPLYLGQAQRKLGQIDEAKASLIRSTMLADDRAIAWGTLADIALQENRLEIALQHITKARAIEPGAAVWKLVEARTLNRQGKAEDAFVLLDAMSFGERREPYTLKLYAQTLGMLGRTEDAAAEYAAAAATSANPDVWYEAAVWQSRAGNDAKAAELAQKAAQAGHDGARTLIESFAEASGD